MRDFNQGMSASVKSGGRAEYSANPAVEFHKTDQVPAVIGLWFRGEHLRVGSRQGDRVRRREFFTLLGGATVAWPPVLHAQSETYRIGTLTVSSFERASHFIKAFEQSMAELSYLSGSNVAYEHRFANGQLERLTDLAKGLAALNVDIIVAGNNASILAASTIPIGSRLTLRR